MRRSLLSGRVALEGEEGGRWRLAAAVLAGTFVVGNLILLGVHISLTSRPLTVEDAGRSDGVVAATQVGSGAILTASAGNEVQLVENGKVTHRRQLDSSIGGIAATPDGTRIYAGTALGHLYEFGRDLTSASVPDRGVGDAIVGMKVGPDGALWVAHGSGAYSDQYYVSVFTGSGVTPSAERQAAFTITALDAVQGRAVYGTVNARVGSLDAESTGRPWTTVVLQPVTTLLAVPRQQRILVGDKAGELELLDASGRSLGVVTVSSFQITALAEDQRTSTFLVGDENGSLYAVNESGDVLLSRSVANGPITAILPTADGRFIVIPRSGPWTTLDPRAIAGAAIADRLAPWWIASALADLLLMVGALTLATARTRRSAIRLLRQAWRARLAYLLIGPALLMITLFSYYPALSAVYYSLTDFSLRSAPRFVGLQNYFQIIATDFYFRTGLLNMVIIIVTSFIKSITVPMLAAELVFWLRNRITQYAFRTLFVLSAVVPGLVFTLLWRQVYDPYTGLLNEILRLIGRPGWQHAWLGEGATALWAIVGVGFPWVTAFSFLILLGGLLNINREFYDAAAIDGAGRWARFWNVDVPLLVPQFRILAFFSVIGAIEGFASIFILTQGGPGYATYVPALEMYFRIGQGDLGYASAIGMILFVMILMVTLFVLRFRRRTVESE